MRTSFHHQSEAQPPNGPLTAAPAPIPHLHAQPRSLVSVGYVQVAELCAGGAVSERTVRAAPMIGKHRPGRERRPRI
jgi:hypothetical protein